MISDKKISAKEQNFSNLTFRKFGSKFTHKTHFLNAKNENIVSKYLLISIHGNMMWIQIESI